MKTIYKYEVIPCIPVSTIDMPVDAKILTAAAQGEKIFLWAEVDTDSPTEKRYFEVLGTGHEIRKEWIEREYINTVFIDWLVFHVYEC